MYFKEQLETSLLLKKSILGAHRRFIQLSSGLLQENNFSHLILLFTTF